ncbi:MAG: imidazole glycerol phosphate synthase subunit HisH [Brevundimonas sp.]|uniref:Imidazole glycerol phosphate synthase subunit HisH n=1 Tax=Brevundimonas albigilva TaxID=1312364 RepID=A0ABY4SKR2_9CAUL|nr:MULTISPECIES: imidazole glycerol phosphate synthase subunit HisH [Brevundimonas]PZU59453.1 MAG: imidazole glycerol phosphate synthase subunit HisH [Brevundimonas sp.]UQV17837.1 imidazole glycerol phosphate synthase subunit HisH [Brevundimonas albigilva]URI14251.1 imidazole glycerol phosphate synthase subunit HisH [Brevundimonas albigilva]
MSEVAVVAYGAGNVASVQFALERLGASVRLTDDPAVVADAERVILPGVGAAGYAMTRLAELGLVEPLRAFSRPLLGVCLGQQLLFERSEEGDGVRMLGVIPGAVRRLAPEGDLPVPHMGWSRLTPDRDDPLLDDVAAGAYAYFVHGFACPDGPATLARADYGGAVPAVVRSANRWGCQFHPERSADTGATILKNFLSLPC